MSNTTLQEQDASFLAGKRYEHELFPLGSELHVVIKKFPFPPEHYLPAAADLLIKIPAGYPNAPLDMFWTNPEIKSINGQPPQKTESREQYHGKEWQRWSRHYVTPWRPGADSLRSFVQSIHAELKKGI